MPVHHIHIPVLVYGNSRRTVELALPVAGAAPLQYELASSSELLHPVIAPVSDIHLAGSAEGYSPGHIELAWTSAVPAPLAQEPAFSGKLLDTVVTGVYHQKV